VKSGSSELASALLVVAGMVLIDAGVRAEAVAGLREAVGDDVQIMVAAEQRYDGGTSISVARAIAACRLGWTGDVEARPQIDEQAIRRGAAMVSHISPEPNAGVIAAEGSVQRLEWFSRRLVLANCPDILDRLFG